MDIEKMIAAQYRLVGYLQAQLSKITKSCFIKRRITVRNELGSSPPKLMKSVNEMKYRGKTKKRRSLMRMGPMFVGNVTREGERNTNPLRQNYMTYEGYFDQRTHLMIEGAGDEIWDIHKKTLRNLHTISVTKVNDTVASNTMDHQIREFDNAIVNKCSGKGVPSRRSQRISLSSLLEEERRKLVNAILNGIEDGLEIANFGEKGRGVIAQKTFSQGEFVVEYAGELIDAQTAKARETQYNYIPEYGCYMFYFMHRNRYYCIDATPESKRMGRLINHSRNGNCKPKLIEVEKRPHIVLLASREIRPGEELVYDYGDRRLHSIQAHPWLAS